jgi:hypothetical protein
MSKPATWTPPDDLDPGCLDVCIALNTHEEIETYWACEGHNQRRYKVFFRAPALAAEGLRSCLEGFRDWQIRDCNQPGESNWLLEGPETHRAVLQAERIAKRIKALAES